MSEVSPQLARAAIEAMPPGAPVGGSDWETLLRLVMSVPEAQRTPLAEKGAPKFGVPAAQVLEQAAALAAQEAEDARKAGLDARIDAVTPDTPTEEIRGTCADLAAMASDLERQVAIKRLAARSKLSMNAVKAAVKEEQQKLRAESAQAHTGVMEHMPGQRVAELFPDWPGPDLAVPPPFHADAKTGRLSKETAFGTEVFSDAPIFPQKLVEDVDSGVLTLTCLSRLDGPWRPISAKLDEWSDSHKIVGLRQYGAPFTSVSAKLGLELVNKMLAGAVAQHAISPERGVSALGWREHDGARVFVLPESAGGPVTTAASAPRFEVAPPDAGEQQVADALSRGGSWEGWCELAKLLCARPVARLALYAALCAPYLELTGQPGFTLHLCCRSSTGKTTALQAAASTVGFPGGAGLPARAGVVADWYGTSISKFRRLAFFRHLPAFLDDAQRVDDPELITQVVYSVANGTDRGRGSVRGSQATARWALTLVSTGEDPIRGYSQRGGMQARAIDLDQRVFETAAEARAARELAGEHHGHTMPRMIRCLAERDPADLRKFQRYTERMLQQQAAQGHEANELVGRVIGAWAAMWVVAGLFHGSVAGALVPWDADELRRFFVGQFGAMLAANPPRHAHDAALDALLNQVGVNPGMKGGPAATDRVPPAGWIGTCQVRVGDEVCVAFETTFAQRFLKQGGWNPDACFAAWAEEGRLVPDSSKHRTRMVRFDSVTVRCVVLRPSPGTLEG